MINENVQATDCTKYLLNERNKLISEEFISYLLNKYGIKNYTINNIKIFHESMTHSSYIISNKNSEKMAKLIKDKQLEPVSGKHAVPLQENSYERLEFLGDSIIHCVLAKYLFKRYNHKHDHDEGFLTKLRTKIENGKRLSLLCRQLKIHEYVLVARNIEQTGGRENNNHIFEDILEAFVGALFLDSNNNHDLCEKFIVNIIEEHIDFAEIISEKSNYKDTLLQYHHKMNWNPPEYDMLEAKEINTKKYFNMCVFTHDRKIAGRGTGCSKKDGEQNAAKEALIKYNQIRAPDLEESDEEEIYEESYNN
jgi:dsRNA-specific ribonuclease